MKFKSLVTALCAGSMLFGAVVASASPYYYLSTGKHGEKRFSQTPPTDTTKFERIMVRADGRISDAQSHANSNTHTSNLNPQAQTAEVPATMTEAQRIAELEKQVQEQQIQQVAERCRTMRANLAAYSTGGRVYETNANGERVYLNDQEISSKRQRTIDAINQHCSS